MPISTPPARYPAEFGGSASGTHDDLSEICAALAHQCGSLYRDRAAIAQDLHWLEPRGWGAL